MTDAFNPSWNRRQLLWGLAGTATSLALHSCTDTNRSAAVPTLTVGVVAWPGYAGHYVALEKKLFEAEGVNVQETFFADGTTSTTAFLAKKIDLSWATSSDAILNGDKVAGVKIIKLVDFSNGADGILGRGINSPADLKGKKVAREDLLFSNILLQSYLQKAGLTLADVTLVDASAATAASAFVGKQVDVAVTYEPYLSQSAKTSGEPVIYSSKGTNLIADVITTYDSVIQEKREAILAYLRAVDQAVQLVQAGDAEALAIVGKRLGVSAAEVQQQLTGLKLFNLADNKTAFDASNPQSLIGNLEFTAKVAEELKVLSQPAQVSQLYDDSLIKAL